MNSINKIKILIVEDELIIAEDIKLQLVELGYDPIGMATSYDESIDLLKVNKVDLALVDVSIYGDKDGIDLARTIKNDFHIPVIFITSHADKQTIERAKTVKPDSYLVKPFNTNDLYSTIEIAFFNFVNANPLSDENSDSQNTELVKESIFIKVDSKLVKLKMEEIRWIKSEGNYLEVHTSTKNHLTRSSLKELLKKLPNNLFIQVHKSFVININYIDAIEYKNVVLGEEKIPLSRSMANELKNRFGGN